MRFTIIGTLQKICMYYPFTMKDFHVLEVATMIKGLLQHTTEKELIGVME